MISPQFRLKTAPPRSGRHALVRRRLEQYWAAINESAAILVTAPQGFGKTALLAQWRRNWLVRGAFVAWVSLDADDDPTRFVDLLLSALRVATGRESFATAAAQGLSQANQERDVLTSLLAEVSILGEPTVVILDDAHRMPQDGLQELLGYLLNNAPPNLQFLIGSRRPLGLQLTDLAASGRIATLNADDLRFSFEESMEFLRARFGARISLDDAVRLHELTEGWPLGAQLAAAAIERAPDLHEAIGRLNTRRDDMRQYFFESMLAHLSAEDSTFLVRVSILEALNPDLCAAVSGSADAARILGALLHDSPVLTEGEGRDWMRLHSMARDFLLSQFDKLPAEQRNDCYRRAAAWYADHGLLQEAARHALLAGDEDLAVSHASKCIQLIVREGRLAEAQAWVRRLPMSITSRDVSLQLTVAWITAIGESAATAPRLVEAILKHHTLSDEHRFTVDLILATAAVSCDKPGLIERALRVWESAPAGTVLFHDISLANLQATLALHAGDTQRVRRLLRASESTESRRPKMRVSLSFGDLLLGLSYLAEGQAEKAIAVLRPRLEMAEREMGRRSHMAAMLAGPLAMAYVLRGAQELALATLADRLDVIERTGMPNAIILAYLALAQCALQRNEQARALDYLVAMQELGESQGIPRIVFRSLAEQARIHALQLRLQTAVELLAQMEAMRPTFAQAEYQLFLPFFEQTRAVVTAYLMLGSGNLVDAEAALSRVGDVPPGMRLNPDVLIIRALRALIAHERGQPGAQEMLAETLSLADLVGVRAFIEDSHPRLAAVAGKGSAAGTAERDVQQAPVARAPWPPGSAGLTVGAAGLLTPQEARVLSLLGAGMTNKEIARAMGLSNETVKWHLSHVFSKLSAGNRKQAVSRARLLGLLDD
jgi:LuxR family maltose regulon positive regulatory protein